MRKLLYIIIIIFLVLPLTVIAFPFNHTTGESSDLPLPVDNQGSSDQMLGCIGDCAACHSITPIEAQTILGKKFNVEKILHIDVKNGYFEIEYETSDGKKEKINLFFSKDKACKDLILLNE